MREKEIISTKFSNLRRFCQVSQTSTKNAALPLNGSRHFGRERFAANEESECGINFIISWGGEFTEEELIAFYEQLDKKTAGISCLPTAKKERRWETWNKE